MATTPITITMDYGTKLYSRLATEYGLEGCSDALAGRALLAGSFPLQVFLDVNWAKTDLDFYVKHEAWDTVFAFFTKQNYVLSDMSENMRAYASLKIDRIATLFFKNADGSFNFQRKIQLMDVKNPMDVVSCFDLNICMLAFTFQPGVDFPIYMGTQGTLADVRNYRAILSDDFAEAYYTGNNFTRNRVAKYRSRGFSIQVPDVITFACKKNKLVRYLVQESLKAPDSILLPLAATYVSK